MTLELRLQGMEAEYLTVRCKTHIQENLGMLITLCPILKRVTQSFQDTDEEWFYITVCMREQLKCQSMPVCLSWKGFELISLQHLVIRSQ